MQARVYRMVDSKPVRECYCCRTRRRLYWTHISNRYERRLCLDSEKVMMSFHRLGHPDASELTIIC